MGSNAPVGSFLEKHGLDTPWMRLLVASTARAVSDFRIEDLHRLASHLAVPVTRPHWAPEVQPQENKRAYLARASHHYDAAAVALKASAPPRHIDYERAWGWYLRLATGEATPADIAKENNLDQQSVHQTVNKFAELLDLRPMVVFKRGRRPGRGEARPRHRLSPNG